MARALRTAVAFPVGRAPRPIAEGTAASAPGYGLAGGGVAATRRSASALDGARVTAGACAVLVGLYLVWRVQEVLLLLLLAILLATAIEPLVNALRRGPFTRGSGVLVIYTVIVLAIGVPAYAAFPTLLDQGSTFVEQLPSRLESLRQYAVRLRPGPIETAAVSAVDSARAQLQQSAPPNQGDLLAAGATALHFLFDVLMVFVLAFYWLVERAALKRAILKAAPRGHARTISIVWLEVEQKLGGWVRGELLLMAAIGLMSGFGYWAIGLPNPLLLAVAAALFEIVPMIGPILSALPAFLVALAIGPQTALVVGIFALIIQQFENNVLLPRIMGHAVGISPLAVLLGILVGGVVYGLPGAFLAVPVAGALQVALEHALGRDDPALRSGQVNHDAEAAITSLAGQRVSEQDAAEVAGASDRRTSS